MKLPSKNQWRQFLKILSKRERITFFIFLFLFLFSGIFLSICCYFEHTKIVPAGGGIFTEAVIGHPRFINPIYDSSNDVDRDLVELIFSGLMKYDGQGQIIPDLAKNYELKEDGKVYEFYLKENLFWQDGSPLTAEDVIFTIETIQNPDYKSPFRANWLGVELEKINELGVRFKLTNPYSPFLENATLKIIPKHIWQDISPQDFPLSFNNLKPVGSGPYKLEDLKQDELGYIKSLALVKNPNYFGKKPNLQKINFLFFEKEEELIEAAQKNEIQGLSLNSPENLKKLNQNWLTYELSLPRYFAVFFNPDKSKILAEEEVRQALNYGVNKKEIIEKAQILGGVVDSPILPEIYGFQPPSSQYEFNQEKAIELLEKAGFIKDETGQRVKIVKKEPAFQFKSTLQVGSKGTEVEKLQECLKRFPEIYPEGEVSGNFGEKTKKAVINFQKQYVEGSEGTGLVGSKTRTKLNEMCFPPVEEKLQLKFSLVTIDQPLLVEVASLLKTQWEAIGVEIGIISVSTSPTSQLEKDFIKPREYDAILVGEVLGLIPDPFPFWHSSQKKDPGLNLADYENKDVDTLLEEARRSLSETERKEKLERFQNLLIDDTPAVFLYTQDYLYLISKEIKGFDAKRISDPSQRFSGVENWYIKTKRVWQWR
jgi:ABC-type transport system substrate-binding protein